MPKEIANATVRYYKLEVPHGNKILLVVVVLNLIVAAVELFPYFVNR
jgi:hypothetical protein